MRVPDAVRADKKKTTKDRVLQGMVKYGQLAGESDAVSHKRKINSLSSSARIEAPNLGNSDEYDIMVSAKK